MDNVPFHHCPSIQSIIQAAGHTLLFLPPYSPFLNPIENLFAQWKNIVRTAKPNTMAELNTAITAGFNMIDSSSCANYFRHMESYISRCLRGEAITD
jgi:hypothetical protein